MVTVWIYALLAAALVSLLSLIGVFIISKDIEGLKRKMTPFISLAIGALFANAALHLLPESFKSSLSINTAMLFFLGGIFLFFILDKYLHWHCHDGKCEISTVGYKALVADGLHNFIDGIVIAAAFLTNPALGVATTLAVAVHEIPQEIVDFGILIHSGFTRAKALMVNFLSALVAVAGAAFALIIGTSAELFTPAMLALTAGMFVYLAGSDLMPELHKDVSVAEATKQVVMMGLGIAIMIALV